jgi:hypothetical protein
LTLYVGTGPLFLFRFTIRAYSSPLPVPPPPLRQ